MCIRMCIWMRSPVRRRFDRLNANEIQTKHHVYAEYLSNAFFDLACSRSASDDRSVWSEHEMRGGHREMHLITDDLRPDRVAPHAGITHHFPPNARCHRFGLLFLKRWCALFVHTRPLFALSHKCVTQVRPGRPVPGRNTANRIVLANYLAFVRIHKFSPLRSVCFQFTFSSHLVYMNFHKKMKLKDA